MLETMRQIFESISECFLMNLLSINEFKFQKFFMSHPNSSPFSSANISVTNGPIFNV